MKITPMAASAPPTVNIDEGRSAGSERLERAKSVLAGKDPNEVKEILNNPDLAAQERSIKRIKMRTQVSPDRNERISKAIEAMKGAEAVTEVPTVASPAPIANTVEDPSTDTLDKGEDTAAAAEATQPLSPQFAALVKQKRALEARERALQAKEAALQSKPQSNEALDQYKARIKSEALKVLQEEGVTYDQLTEQILSSSDPNSSTYSKIESEIKALNEKLENQNKSFQERDAQAEKQVLSQIKREADQLVAQGEDYEMVREAGYTPQAVELVHRTFKETGELMDITEALKLVENELLENFLKFGRINKARSRLNPEQPTQQPVAQQADPNRKVMRTLTNRDGASSISMSKRERAIAVMEGRLK